MELDQIPKVLDDLDCPVVLRIRHEPTEASARLLESLGVGYEIAASAPPCVRECGRPECRRRTAAELRQIAELIDAETRRRNLPGVRERVDRGIERGIRVVREPLVRYERKTVTVGQSLEHSNGNGAADDEEEARPVHEGRTCREPGCENLANARWSRGALSGICWEVHVPETRAALAAAGRRRHAHTAGRTIPAALGPPLPEPEPGPEVVAEAPAEPSFVELAAALEEARLACAAAKDAYEDALARFLEHPVVCDLELDERQT